MTFWITLSRSDSAAGTQIIARTASPAIVRAVVAGLYDNWILEDDGQDTIADPEFLAGAQTILVALTEEMRRQAIRLWEGEPPEPLEDGET